MFTRNSLCLYSHQVYSVIRSTERKIFHICIGEFKVSFSTSVLFDIMLSDSLINPSCGSLSQFLVLLIRCEDCAKMSLFSFIEAVIEAAKA